MSAETDRAFHLERAAQCRKMAQDANEQSVRHLHEQLADFHEAEARKGLPQMAANQNAEQVID